MLAALGRQSSEEVNALTTAILAVCPLLCVVMLGMMWRMRGGSRRDHSEEDKE
jgi:hypothetical protein